MKTRFTSKRRLPIIGVAAALVALTAIAAAGAALSTKASAQASCSTLNLLTWEGYAEPAAVKPFEKKYGVKVKATYVGSDAELVAKGATQKGTYAIMNVGGSTRGRQVAAGAIQPLDPSRLTNWKDIYAPLKSPYRLNGKLWGVPSDWDVNPFVYDPTVLKKPPTSYSIMWDPVLKNKVALWNEISLIFIGANVLGMDKKRPATAPGGVFNLSDKQLETIKAKMLTLKGQVRAMWNTGGDAIQLFANKEAAAAPAWNYIYQQLKAKKTPIAKATLKSSGAVAWVDGPGIGAGVSTECKDMAYNWINWVTSPQMQAKLGLSTGYSVANPKARKYMPAAEWAKSFAQTSKAVKTAIVRLDPARPDKYQQITEEIVNGLS